MEYLVELTTAAERPTAVVAATTTWERFPTLWKELLDQVWAFLRDSDLRTDGHNVMPKTFAVSQKVMPSSTA